MAKTIKNKTLSLMLNEVTPMTYADLLHTVTNKPIEGGIDIETMRVALKIMNYMKDNRDADVLTVDDSDFSALKANVLSMRWNLYHNDILEFVDYIKDLA